MLDTELKREYQQFLQEHNRGKADSDGRPDRSPDEIARWAVDHDLPEHPLSGRGYDSIGCWPCTRAVGEGEDARAGRWAGMDKTECGLHL